jgi:predicted permease
MDTVFQDFRYGLRTLRKSRGFTTIAVLTLALGLGANTAIFGILYALLLRSLPAPRPDRLVELGGIYRNGSKVPLSYGVVREIEQNQRVFSEVLAWTWGRRSNIQKDTRLFLANVRGVSGNYYSALDATPYMGRLIGPEDGSTTAVSAVAVLGYEYWQRQFGGDPKIIGTSIRIEGDPYTIIGVSRRWFTGMTPGELPEIAVPLTAPRFTSFMTQNAILWLWVTARLKDGVTIAQARDQLLSFWRDALAAHPPTTQPGQRLQSFLNMGLDLAPAATGINADLRKHFARPLYVLMGIVTLILLVACVNLANLMLARAAARLGDINVRVALGASRFRIIRQLLIETLLLAAGGALFAIAFASWGSRLLVAFMAHGLTDPILLDVRLDWRLFLFATGAALLTALLISLAPAWRLARQQPADLIRSDRRTMATGSGPLAKVLIVTQIAISLALLLGAGLLLRTFENLRSFDPHFERAGVLDIVLQPQPAMSKKLDMLAYRKDLANQLRAVPGVTSVGFASMDIPAGEDFGWRDSVSFMGDQTQGESGRVASMVIVSPEFFQTLGIPIISGRGFDWQDDAQHPPIAIVDDNLAHRLNTASQVVGMQVRFGVQSEFQGMQIVGVARSARLMDLRDGSAAVIYVPLAQHPQSYDGNLFIRARNPGAAAREVESVIQSAGQEYALKARTLQDTVDQALVEDQVTAMLSSIFAALALLLAGIGLFGLISYDVTRRTREIGIRMALGSQREAILRHIMRESLVLTVVGVLVGTPCALAATRLITHLLFGVTALDGLSFVIAASTLLLAGAIAGYWPARRAMSIDPIVALHYE